MWVVYFSGVCFGHTENRGFLKIGGKRSKMTKNRFGKGIEFAAKQQRAQNRLNLGQNQKQKIAQKNRKEKYKMKIGFMLPILKKLRALLTRKQKIYLVYLFLMTLFLSLIETIGISVIMPFITVASNHAKLDEGRYKQIFDFLGFESKGNFIIFFGVCIIAYFIFRALYNIFYNYVTIKYSQNVYRSIAERMLKRILNMPYVVYSNKNGVQRGIGLSESNNVSLIILAMLQVASEIIVLLLLYVFMIAVNWMMTIGITVILIFAVFFIIKNIISRSKKIGAVRVEASKKSGKAMGDAINNLKMAKLKGVEDDLTVSYIAANDEVARANLITALLGAMPRNVLESLGFSLIVVSVLFISWFYKNPDKIIPIIAMFALGMYRILPSINKVIANLNLLAFNTRSLDVIYEELHQEIEIYGNDEIQFEKSIKLENASFQYLVGGTVLDNVSFEIKKGEHVAITGESGGGKSTLADILIGIFIPKNGTLYIDDVPVTHQNIRSWRKKIGYIPQKIELFDGTAADNIAFCSEFNAERVIEVLKITNMWHYLKDRGGINARVGEGGIQLSGGQRQRIGIARALYDNPDVLVLDEATSALDNENEACIMEEIYKLGADKTLIIIAHRLSTVERCKRQIKIVDGKLA
ncbi:MAG: ABC transporter ATP-binding protein [Treponemataceae bacterium]|nr:MAG: ABC transporter ATP-binding protein [Treponemataceae bacterium]